MPVFTTGSIIFVLTIVLNVAIAAFVYANNPKSATNRLFFALSASVSVWLITMLVASTPLPAQQYLLWARATITFATPMNLLFFLFASTVPDAELGMRRRWLVPLLVAATVVTAISASPLGFSGVVMEQGPRPVPGAAFPLFGLFQTLLNVGVIVALFMKARGATGERRVQLRLVLLGIVLMLGMITGTIFLPVLLIGDPTYVPYAPLYVLLFTGLTGYVIFRRGFLEVKVVAAEVFSAILMFISAAQLFQSASPTDLALRLFVLIAVGVISVLFIRSIRDEVKQREELQTLSKRLADANEQLKAMDELKSEFISIASHQLRTPISVIKGYLSLMLEGAYGKQQEGARDKIEHMYEMNERLVQMVNNMLNVSRMEKSKLEYVCAPADVGKIASDASDEMVLKAKQAGVTVVADVPGEPVEAYVDKEKLQEVFSNLLDNAIKYSPKGGEITVKVAPHRRGEEVMVTVRDEGLGMTQEEAGKVFRKFYRIRSDKTIGIAGTGLGLYVCLMFVEGMGGKIWIERTAPNKGTTFAFVLPTRPKQECARPARRKT